MPTVNQLTDRIGTTVQVAFESVAVSCTVLDAKTAYGNVRLLVRPENGRGQQWIELGRLREYSSDRTPTENVSNTDRKNKIVTTPHYATVLE